MPDMSACLRPMPQISEKDTKKEREWENVCKAAQGGAHGLQVCGQILTRHTVCSGIPFKGIISRLLARILKLITIRSELKSSVLHIFLLHECINVGTG
jgi:hypothetical protein